MVDWQESIDCAGQRSRLHRANTHHADPVRARRCHDVAGFRGSVEKFQPAGWVQQIGNALHCCRGRALAKQFDDHVRMAYAGQTPGTNQALTDQPLEDWADMLDKSCIERHAASGVGPLRYMILVGDHVRMEKKQIEARQSQAPEALFNRFEMLMPPGYTSIGSMKNFIRNRTALGGGKMTAEALIQSGTALIGSPETVLAGIERMRERTGFGILVALLQFGILSE